MDIPQKHGADARNRNNQAPIRLSLSPPGRVPVSPPMSPNSEAVVLANARWTPCKEQLELLEGLYRQGLQTPTAEQIQGIAGRLREHGPVVGKNVFYWFQNHKARQRQKHKQQNLAYFARQFHRPMPLPVLHRLPTPPATTPVPVPACNRSEVNMYRQPSFYSQTPQAAANANAAHYSQTQALLYPGFGKAPAQAEAPALSMYQHPAPNSAGGTQQLRGMRFPSASGAANAGSGSGTRETLQLFPLQPTCWQMREKKKKKYCSSTGSGSPSPMTPSGSGSGSGSASSSFSWEPESPKVPFYDFFGLHSGGR